MATTGLTLGALGGPHTFNGQAAQAMIARYPEFSAIVHFQTSGEAAAAAMRGDVDATCAPEQSSATGFHAGMLERMTAPDSALYAIAEIARVYHCSLLGKPGAQLSQIKHVLGHDGSVAHSRGWLEENLPDAKISVVPSHSHAAAKAVLDSDGTVASVGSPDLAAKSGLLELAKDIDRGGMVNYWAISLQSRFSAMPDRLVVTARFGDDRQMSELIARLLRVGFDLRTAYPRVTGLGLDRYDWMLRFSGKGPLDSVRAAVALCPTARLAGAFEI